MQDETSAFMKPQAPRDQHSSHLLSDLWSQGGEGRRRLDVIGRDAKFAVEQAHQQSSLVALEARQEPGIRRGTRRLPRKATGPGYVDSLNPGGETGTRGNKGGRAVDQFPGRLRTPEIFGHTDRLHLRPTSFKNIHRPRPGGSDGGH